MKPHLRHLKRPTLWSLGLLLVADGLFFGLTNPRTLASIWLIPAFVLLAATLYYLCKAVLVVLSWYGLRARRPKRLATTLTGIIVALTALQSIGELSKRDILVALPLVVLLYLYLSRAALGHSGQTT